MILYGNGIETKNHWITNWETNLLIYESYLKMYKWHQKHCIYLTGKMINQLEHYPITHQIEIWWQRYICFILKHRVSIIFILWDAWYSIIYQNCESRSFTLGKFFEFCFCPLYHVFHWWTGQIPSSTLTPNSQHLEYEVLQSFGFRLWVTASFWNGCVFTCFKMEKKIQYENLILHILCQLKLWF